MNKNYFKEHKAALLALFIGLVTFAVDGNYTLSFIAMLLLIINHNILYLFKNKGEEREWIMLK